MFYAFALIIVASISNVFTTELTPLVVLSFEDFHPGNYSSKRTPNLHNLYKKSSGPTSVDPVFPTTTYVNLFTMSTGVTPNVHGVYGDIMFDNDGNKISNTAEQFYFKKDIEPIWIENQNPDEGRYSGVMMWPGSQFDYKNKKAEYIIEPGQKMEWSERASKIVDWMTQSEKKANLVMAYFETTPNNSRKDQKTYRESLITKCDNIIGQIHLELTNANIGEFHMVIISSHSREQIKFRQVLELENLITAKDDVKVIHSGPLVFIRPKTENYESLYKTLSENDSEFSVYNSEDMKIKWEWEIPSLKRVILLVAKSGYSFYENIKSLTNGLGSNKKNFVTEDCGYEDSANMGGHMVANGPKFLEQYYPFKKFSIIQMYHLFRYLLDLINRDSAKHILDENVKEILKDFNKNYEAPTNTGEDNLDDDDDDDEYQFSAELYEDDNEELQGQNYEM